MQESLLWINTVFCLIAVVVNLKRIRKNNPRRALRVAAVVILSYMFAVFFLSAVGVISQTAVALWMRWFINVIAIYFIVEAQNG